jgi:protoheme IX farnesyltransferase
MLAGVFKLRIGFAIMLTALAGVAVSAGSAPAAWQTAVLAIAVLTSSAAAGAFNQLVECDLDARMQRTRHRPFATGRLRGGTWWFASVAMLFAASVAAAAAATNAVAAAYVFCGAFVYGVVYTVWLKRRTWLNIVVGGAAGSFAVLAGAAAVDPDLGAVPLLLAAVLFLWTPPHFWSLAYLHRDDYRDAGVPMLPAVVEDRVTARAVLAHTLALLVLSLVPALLGLGPIYLAGALSGGLYFTARSVAFLRRPGADTARANFRASLLQLGLLLAAAMADRSLAGFL